METPNPHAEDSLRVLRALRFAARLGFAIQADTLSAMMAAGEGLSHDAPPPSGSPRSSTAPCWLPHAGQALRDYPRVLFLALPELSPMLHTPQRTPFHAYDLWEHTLRTVEATDAQLPLRWAALLHDAGKPAAATHDADGTSHFKGHAAISAGITEEIMLRLKQPRALRELRSPWSGIMMTASALTT